MDEGVKIKPVSTPPLFYGYLAVGQLLADVDFGLRKTTVGQSTAFQHFHLQLGERAPRARDWFVRITCA